MVELSYLLQVYPVLESVVTHLSFGDLLNLSRTSSEYRAILHGLPNTEKGSSRIHGSEVRKSLLIGHATKRLFWKSLKSRSQMICAEPGHKKGGTPKGCRLCAMPVCTACTVKGAFEKKDNAFANRKRHLCEKCWLSGNPQIESLHYAADTSVLLVYQKTWMCPCTAGDGYLCSPCRTRLSTEQKEKSLVQCAGKACVSSVGEDYAGMVCIWCNLRIPMIGSLEQRWQNFEARTRDETNLYCPRPGTLSPQSSIKFPAKKLLYRDAYDCQRVFVPRGHVSLVRQENRKQSNIDVEEFKPDVHSRDA